jgi:putative GTP pyrophosphokinase
METPNLSVVDDFEQLRPDYTRFTSKLDTLLRDLLSAKKIEIHLLESRTKNRRSLREKLLRSAKTYKDPLKEVTDLTGLRIITYYQDEADAVAKLIDSEFIVDKENSVVHASTAAEFGYKSTHYVVSLNPGRASLLEWNGLADFKAEVQVRTVLQHAWAAVSHKLQYKREEDVPAALKRKLFRLSALFELADDEFISLRDASGTIKRQITELVAQGNRQLPLDYVSLSQLLETSAVVAKLASVAAEIGFNFDFVDSPYGEGEVRDTVSDLIQLATIAGIKTIEEFEGQLKGSLLWARDYLDNQFNRDEIEEGIVTWHVTPPFICELILICTAVDKIKIRDLLRLGYAKDVGVSLLEVARKFDAKT